MSEWRNGRIWSWDTETTGVQVETDRLVTSTLLKIEGAKIEQHEWLIDPGIEIPEGAAKVHGISTAKARAEGRPPAECVAEILDLLTAAWASGDPVVIYNAPYDITLFDREAQRHLGKRLAPHVGAVIDPLVIDKHINPFVRGQGARKLINACRRYGITLTEDEAHTSAGDTLAAARLAYMVAGPTAGAVLRGGENRKGLVHRMPLAELVEAQAGWSEQQQRDFADYLATRRDDPQGAKRVLSEIGWPIKPDPVAEDSDPPF